MNANLYIIEDYDNETTFRPQKNKPNSNPILSAVGGFPKGQNELKIACRKIWPHHFYIAGHKNIDEHLNSQYTTART